MSIKRESETKLVNSQEQDKILPWFSSFPPSLSGSWRGSSNECKLTLLTMIEAVKSSLCLHDEPDARSYTSFFPPVSNEREELTRESFYIEVSWEWQSLDFLLSQTLLVSRILYTLYMCAIKRNCFYFYLCLGIKSSLGITSRRQSPAVSPSINPPFVSSKCEARI